MKIRSSILWIAVFALGSIFQLWRESRPDFVIYALVAALLLWESQNRVRRPRLKYLRFPIAAWILIIETAILMFAPIHSGVATISSLLVLPMLFAIMWREDPQDGSSAHVAIRKSARIWSSLALLLSLCELGNYFASDITGSDSRFPTLTVLIDPILASSAGKIAFIFLWSLLGVELFKMATIK